MATATMTWGNLAALHQTNLKRFLAYSSITQAGYLMMGLIHPGALGLTSVLFYLWVYLFSNLAAFGVVTAIAAATGKEDVRDYVGLSLTNPHLALVMMLAMFSLAGIPPLAGFFGKFYLFAAVAERGWYWLVMVGAANATISLYYYLVVIKWMYLLQPTEAQPALPGLTLSAPLRWALGLTAAGMVLVGLVPQAIRWVETAAAAGF